MSTVSDLTTITTSQAQVEDLQARIVVVQQSEAEANTRLLATLVVGTPYLWENSVVTSDESKVTIVPLTVLPEELA